MTGGRGGWACKGDQGGSQENKRTGDVGVPAGQVVSTVASSCERIENHSLESATWRSFDDLCKKCWSADRGGMAEQVGGKEKWDIASLGNCFQEFWFQHIYILLARIDWEGGVEYRQEKNILTWADFLKGWGEMRFKAKWDLCLCWKEYYRVQAYNLYKSVSTLFTVGP